MFDKYEEQKKDEILQRINDILEEYDWGEHHKKMILKLSFKGKFWLCDPEIIIRDEKLDKEIEML